ncbi:unnamed protein product [Meloidogyne enterolobii]|uniref:Uncharacterized protein n=1 Tax=Meloidogyne enterolobii TaxID=390850 RepID=A0ACB0YJT7_MELEN
MVVVSTKIVLKFFCNCLKALKFWVYIFLSVFSNRSQNSRILGIQGVVVVKTLKVSKPSGFLPSLFLSSFLK